jgi:hypothetical protein
MNFTGRCGHGVVCATAADTMIEHRETVTVRIVAARISPRIGILPVAPFSRMHFRMQAVGQGGWSAKQVRL